MIVMAGGFPTDFPFPDDPDAVPAERLGRIPPTYRQAVARGAPINTDKDTIIHRMLRDRKADRPGDLFWWARKEREFVAAISTMLGSQIISRMVTNGTRLAKPLLARVRGGH